MQISDLHVFLTVSNLKSFSKAAKALHLTQPAVSHKIQLLEVELNTLLFNRIPQGVELTLTGQIVFKYANNILHTYHDMNDHLSDLAQKNKGKIFVGGESLIANYFLPCKIWSFKEKFPMIDIKMITGDQHFILKQLNDREIDFAFVNGIINEPSGFVSEIIANKALHLIVPNNNEWEHVNEITVEDLYQLKIFLPDSKNGFRKEVEQAFLHQGIPFDRLNTNDEISNISAIKSLIEAGYGATFLCDKAVNNELLSGTIKIVDIKSFPLSINISIIYREDAIKDLHKNFIDHVTHIVQLEKSHY